MKYLTILFLSFSVQAQNLGDIDPNYDTNLYDYMYATKDGTYVCETLTRTMHGGYVLIDCEHAMNGTKIDEILPTSGEITLVSNNTKG